MKKNTEKKHSKMQMILNSRSGEKNSLPQKLRRKLSRTNEVVRAILNSATRQVNPAEYNAKMFPRMASDMKVCSVDSASGKRTELDKKQQKAMDDYAKPNSFIPNIPLDIMGKFQNTYIGWDACAILAQNVWINRAIEQPVKDALSHGFRFVNADIDAKNKKSESELAKLLRQSEKEFKLTKVLKQASVKKRTFGWAYVVPTFRTSVDMSVPFNINAIPKNSYTGMKVVEPRWMFPEFNYSSNLNPLDKDFYEPVFYYTSSGKRIHRSWLIKLVNIEVGDIIKPVYFYGGVSVPQQIYERVYAAERVADEVPLLVLTKRTFIADAELNNYLTNPSEVEERLNAIVQLRDNFGIFIKDIGTDVSQIDTALAGLDEVINSQYYLVAAIAEVPVSKFLKTPIKGMNATGQAEKDDYNQNLVRYHNDDFRPIIDFHSMLMTKSETGSVIELEAEFNELDVPTALDQAQINDLTATTVAQLVQSGIIDREEARERIRTAIRSGFSFLTKEPPEIDIEPFEEAAVSSEHRDPQGRFRKSKVEPEV